MWYSALKYDAYNTERKKVCSSLGLQQIYPSAVWDQRSRSSLLACWGSLHVCSSHCRPAGLRDTPGGRRSTSSSHTWRQSEGEWEAPRSVDLRRKKVGQAGIVCAPRILNRWNKTKQKNNPSTQELCTHMSPCCPPQSGWLQTAENWSQATWILMTWSACCPESLSHWMSSWRPASTKCIASLFKKKRQTPANMLEDTVSYLAVTSDLTHEVNRICSIFQKVTYFSHMCIVCNWLQADAGLVGAHGERYHSSRHIWAKDWRNKVNSNISTVKKKNKKNLVTYFIGGTCLAPKHLGCIHSPKYPWLFVCFRFRLKTPLPVRCDCRLYVRKL